MLNFEVNYFKCIVQAATMSGGIDWRGVEILICVFKEFGTNVVAPGSWRKPPKQIMMDGALELSKFTTTIT